MSKILIGWVSEVKKAESGSPTVTILLVGI